MFTNYFEVRGFTFGAGPRLISRWRNRFLYLTPRYLRYLSQTVVLTPWVMGFFSLYLLAFVPQMREIYIGVIEDGDVIRGVLGLASISAFSALLYYWNHKLVTRRIDGIYPDHADIYFDRGVVSIRDLKSMIASALPFAGLSIGLLAARAQVLNDAGHIKTVSNALGKGLERTAELQGRLESLPGAFAFSLALTISVSIGLILALHLSRDNRRWQRWYLAACYVLAVLLVAVPVVASNTVVAAARLAGPLAGTGLVLFAGAVAMRFLVWIAAQIIAVLLTLPSVLLLSMHRVPVALRQVAAVLIPLLAVVAIGARFVETDDGGQQHRMASLFEGLQERAKNSNRDRKQLAEDFASWLNAREIGSGEYPVFVVTAEGGGIYAASAASFFLAGMQERCPGFAEHIFAVSAVSGGSVGASLFDAALADKAQGKDISRAGGALAGCLEPAGPGELFERLSKITKDDHLSPVLAYILPDIVRDIWELFAGAPAPKEPCKNEVPFEWFGRDKILEKSLIASFGRSKSKDRLFTTVCPDAADAGLLIRNFKDAWSPGGKLPALLLNATWVETGYRVAFSPFPLQELGEGTLYSFGDVGTLPGEGHMASETWQNPSLIGAAAISAGFPFIMPPWATNRSAKSRWTFVDGGYADSSGVTTGLELYHELKRELNDSSEMKDLKDASGRAIHNGQIKLYLISLTDAYAEPDFRKITGSSLDDFISPISTVLTVRELLAKRAVTQAYGELGDEFITVQLDQESFPLSLGWKLSALSSDIIRFSMGRPDRCNRNKEKHPDWTVRTVNHNSCELQKITAVLAPPPLPARPVPPPPVQPQQSQPPQPQPPASWRAVPQ
ncbi:MAG: hypothetical protein ACLPWS_13950 [Rhodomicrobium sp.]